MFEYLGTELVSIDPGFDVLRYLTVRTIGGTITALLILIFLGPIIISFLKSMQFEQFVRDDGPKSHYKNRNSNNGRINNSFFISNLNSPMG